MASAIFVLMIMIWVMITIMLRRLSRGKDNAVKRNRPSETAAGKWLIENIEGKNGRKRPLRSTDGHLIRKEQDITCRQFGHHHPESEESSTRYIVHDDLEDGYIILNGKKMLRTEADQYENTI